MQRLKKALLPCALILTLSMVFLGTAAARTANRGRLSNAYTQTTALQCGSWSVVASPNVSTGDTALGAVAAVSANDIWAVGNQVNANSSIAKTLIEHWDGTAWKIVSSPNVKPFGNSLYGVAAASANDVWADGYAIDPTSHVAHTLIEHWDGSAWSIAASPDPGDSYNILYGAAALSSTDAWAVGYDQKSGHFKTLIEHWNGTKWEVVSSPNPGTSNTVLYAIKAVGANDIWAAGQALNDGGPDQPLVEHWDGSAWSVVTLPHTSLSGALYGITASSENAWAVGDLGSPTAPMKNLVTEKDDARWSIVSNAQANTQDNQLFAVTAANNDDLWAVGNVLDPSSGNYATLIEHSDGQNWSIVPSPNPGGSAGNNILGGVVALSSHDVWAVGGYDNGGNTMTLIEHYC